MLILSFSDLFFNLPSKAFPLVSSPFALFEKLWSFGFFIYILPSHLSAEKKNRCPGQKLVSLKALLSRQLFFRQFAENNLRKTKPP